MSLLVVEDLSVLRGDRVVLRSLSFSLGAGEGLHLRGGNGSGKTTLLEVLAGLRTPASGQLRSPGAENLHWVGHKNALHGALTARENLEFWCRLNGADPERVPSALAAFDLQGRRPCRNLSTGQRRRAALARLLLADRPLWLLDEPFAGLDQDAAHRLADLVRMRLEQGGTVVLTSHQALPERIAGLQVRELN